MSSPHPKTSTRLGLLTCVAALGAAALWWSWPSAPRDLPAEDAPQLGSPHDSAHRATAATGSAVPPERATWVAEETCQACHAAEVEAWRGSDHQRAMQLATEETVLGDFRDAARAADTLSTDTERHRFFRRDGAFWIHTPGPDGELAEYRVAYTFGVDPLQQYLLRLPDGRLQAHGAAWDVRAGRWVHLYDGAGVDHRHRLHWTGAQQNADFMCVECHTTGFRRSDDPSKTNDPSWHALGVGCQSCHGPASAHLTWAERAHQRAPENNRAPGTALGDASKGFAHGPTKQRQVELCARCHSRRTPIGLGEAHGAALLDAYLPEILTAELYEVDGKIEDEVFEWGSFRQSRMSAAGVVCSDCHDPHRAELRVPGNGVCTQCHGPAATPSRAGIDGARLLSKDYDHPAHHHHTPGSAGAACVDCHMPGRIYMGNDLRHDHGFTSPHPPQARALGHSDPCLACHRDDEAPRVVAAFERWYPGATPRDGGYARDLHLARSGGPGAARALLDQLAREDLPDLRRATLLSELARYPSAAAERVLAAALGDPSPLVRHTAVEHVTLLSPRDQQRLLLPLLADPIRAVRLAASSQLLELALPGTDPAALRTLISEYEQVQRSLDRAESYVNLAGVYEKTGRPAEVEPALRRALERDPTSSPALLLLSQWREQAEGDVAGAERLLREALAVRPNDGALWYGLGLLQVRQGQRDAALGSLRRAHEVSPDSPDFGYALAAALRDADQGNEALELLRTLSARHPTHRALRLAHIDHLRAAGRSEEARAVVAELAAQNPDDPFLQRR